MFPLPQNEACILTEYGGSLFSESAMLHCCFCKHCLYIGACIGWVFQLPSTLIHAEGEGKWGMFSRSLSVPVKSYTEDFLKDRKATKSKSLYCVCPIFLTEKQKWWSLIFPCPTLLLHFLCVVFDHNTQQTTRLPPPLLILYCCTDSALNPFDCNSQDICAVLLLQISCCIKRAQLPL